MKFAFQKKIGKTEFTLTQPPSAVTGELLGEQAFTLEELRQAAFADSSLVGITLMPQAESDATTQSRSAVGRSTSSCRFVLVPWGSATSEMTPKAIDVAASPMNSRSNERSASCRCASRRG